MKSLTGYRKEIEALRFNLRKIYSETNAWLEGDKSVLDREKRLVERIAKLEKEMRKIYGEH